MFENSCAFYLVILLAAAEPKIDAVLQERLHAA
jgi:hypothetical protein